MTDRRDKIREIAEALGWLHVVEAPHPNGGPSKVIRVKLPFPEGWMDLDEIEDDDDDPAFLLAFAAYVRAETARHHDLRWLITDECVSVYRGRERIPKDRRWMACQQYDDTDPISEANAVIDVAWEVLRAR